MTKGRVIAAAAVFVATLMFVQTASAQYPSPEGSLECTTQVNVTIENSTSVTATLRDTAGNPLPDRTIQFSIVGQPGDASLSSNAVTTDADGKATVTLDAGSSAGNVSVAAASDGLECRSVSEVLGATVSPPSTGNAGLAGDSGTSDSTVMKVVILMALGSFAGLLWNRSAHHHEGNE